MACDDWSIRVTVEATAADVCSQRGEPKQVHLSNSTTGGTLGKQSGELTPGDGYNSLLAKLMVKPLAASSVVRRTRISLTMWAGPTNKPSSKYQIWFRDSTPMKSSMASWMPAANRSGPSGSPCCTPVLQWSTLSPQTIRLLPFRHQEDHGSNPGQCRRMPSRQAPRRIELKAFFRSTFNMTWSRFRFLANARAASTAAWTQGPFPPTPSWSGCKSEIAPPHSLIAAYLFI